MAISYGGLRLNLREKISLALVSYACFVCVLFGQYLYAEGLIRLSAETLDTIFIVLGGLTLVAYLVIEKKLEEGSI